MKNIDIYYAEKYLDAPYEETAENIYTDGEYFMTSISFEQEPEFGEGDSPQEISDYPLANLLDEYHVFVSDPYEELNEDSDVRCYLEIASGDEENVENFLDIIGCHVYSRLEKNEAGETVTTLVIE